MSADRLASGLARLLSRSRSSGESYNLLLSRFAIERLLYRLSMSPHAGGFVRNGALPEGREDYHPQHRKGTTVQS